MRHKETKLTWRAHPAGERLGAAVGAAAVILLSAGAATLTTHSAAYGMLSLVVLVAALHRFFFPSEFEIDAEGITVRHLFGRQTWRWHEVRRFAHDRRGGCLSRERNPSRLDPFRGMHLLFSADRDAEIARIRACLAAEER
jgi:hypothetical protein